jgi:hypothetical protein
MMGRPPKPEIERFWLKVKFSETGCWEWLGYKDDDGYGTFLFDGKTGRAHRFSYQYFVGPLIGGLTLDHSCRNRGCVCPWHLEQMGSVKNVMLGLGVGALNIKKTHCPKGHEYSSENTYIDPRGFRYCRTCATQYQIEHREVLKIKNREAVRRYKARKKKGSMKVPEKFETKEQWIQWRQEWRERYRRLSESIRVSKATLRDAQRHHVAGSRTFQMVWDLKRDAYAMMFALEKAKILVRDRLRALGIPAPDPKVREKPAPRPKRKWTPEEIADARAHFEHRGRMADADAHSD